MKILNVFLLLICVSCWLACGDGESDSTSVETAEATGEVAVETAAEPTAVCLWGKAGLREKPGAGSSDNKYLATIVFGETVALTGESVEKEKEKRTYLKVKLSDGEEGWVNSYIFAENASLAAATGAIEVYRRPDLLTAKNERFETGELVALMEGDNVDWIEAVGEERKPQGWIQRGKNLSTDKSDVAVAVLYAKAMQEKDRTKREELLQNIAQNADFGKSQLIEMVDQALIDVSSAPSLSENQMAITGDNLNVRSEPSTESDNVVFQLNSGDVCTVIEKGQQEQIGDMNDYWYKISHDGQEGWVYGYHTSRRAQ